MGVPTTRKRKAHQDESLKPAKKHRKSTPVKAKTVYQTPPSTPPAYEALHPELEDLLQLYSAFLTALSIHYAHNGTSSPADLRDLLPLITKTWRRRDVTLEDIQKLLGVQGKVVRFHLSDYGNGNISLVLTDTSRSNTGNFIDETRMTTAFMDRLEELWAACADSTSSSCPDISAFLSQLPLAPITLNLSAAKASPLFAKGAQRLQDLKSAARTASASPNAAQHHVTTPGPNKTPQAVSNRTTSLLDRILQKQTLASNSPTPPTKAELERTAALHRVEEISRVLDLLAGARPRASFSMAMLVQNLQNSLRSPMAREEVELCLRLMAEEVAPGYVSLLHTGSEQSRSAFVIVVKGARPGLGVLKEGVQSALQRR
ncbi:hypothetical protein LTR50_003512 [Elasticomyces elasticus]|nr:hypothetical protein LTR50_003512 [Elasticomyces elasticus]